MTSLIIKRNTYQGINFFTYQFDKVQKFDYPLCLLGSGETATLICTLLVVMLLGLTPMEGNLAIVFKITNVFTLRPSNSILGIYPMGIPEFIKVTYGQGHSLQNDLQQQKTGQCRSVHHQGLGKINCGISTQGILLSCKKRLSINSIFSMLPLECKSQENKIIHLYVFISAQRNTGKIHKKFNSEFTYTGYRRGVVKAE